LNCSNLKLLTACKSIIHFLLSPYLHLYFVLLLKNRILFESYIRNKKNNPSFEYEYRYNSIFSNTVVNNSSKESKSENTTDSKILKPKFPTSSDSGPEKLNVKTRETEIIVKILKSSRTRLLTYEQIFERIKLKFAEFTYLFRNNKYCVYSRLNKEKCFVLLDNQFWTLDPDYESVYEDQIE